MGTLLIGYDLDKPGQDYSNLVAEIKRLGAWWHNLDSTWLVKIRSHARSRKEPIDSSYRHE
jgi:hypothetical protein